MCDTIQVRTHAICCHAQLLHNSRPSESPTWQVALRCIAGEAPSDTLRESGWIDRGIHHDEARKEQGNSAEAPSPSSAHDVGDGAADDAERGVDKDCLLDFRPLDGLQLSEPETANTPTSDQTAVSLTLRRWYARRPAPFGASLVDL